MELGNTARSIYLQTDDNEIMLPLLDGSGGGAAADELVQSTLDDFGEPTIAGKTLFEIMAMSGIQRHRWYKIITFEERDEIMQIFRMIRNAKLSEIVKKQWKNPEFRTKFSEMAKKRFEDSEQRARMKEIAKKQWENPERREKFVEWSKKQWEDPEYRAKMRAAILGEKNPMRRPEIRAKYNAAMNQPEYRAKMRAASSGENNSRWQGGISFEPYCPKFNTELKEKIRNRFGRVCLLCGKSALFNGRRLSIHHLDGNKTQGCNGVRWLLVPLCTFCHHEFHNADEQTSVELEFLLAIKSEEYRRG